MKIPFIATKQSIVMVAKGTTYTVPSNHPSFDDLVDHLKENIHDEDEAIRLASIPEKIKGETFGKVVVGEDHVVYYNNEPVSSHLTERLVELMAEGFDHRPWARFMDKAYANPNETAREGLYDWLETGNMPITEDGNIIGFKKVRDDYTSIHVEPDGSHRPHIFGEVSEMDRELCDGNRSRECSTGLHFCSQEYLPKYGTGPGNTVITVEIDPADVVAFPRDYNNSKGRTCRYIPRAQAGLDEEQSKVTQAKVFDAIKGEAVKPSTRKGKKYGKKWTAKQLVKAVGKKSLRQFAKDNGLAKSTLRDWYAEAKDIVDAGN